MKILCCGARDWDDEKAVRRELAAFGPGTEIVHGACRGADKMCGEVGHRLGYVVHSHPAQWTKFGRAAGPLRNKEMLDRHPDIGLVLAFHHAFASSKGTMDMIKQASKRGIEAKIICF